MTHICCICGYRVPLSKDYPFDSEVKDLYMCRDCKEYIDRLEQGERAELYEVSKKYIAAAVGSNERMDGRVKHYLCRLAGIEEIGDGETGGAPKTDAPKKRL